MNAAIELTPAGLIINDLTIVHRLFISDDTVAALELPDLTSISGSINIFSNPVLILVKLPALVTGAVFSRIGMQIVNCPLLTNIVLPVYQPANYQWQIFKNNALNEASVDNILARCVASTSFVRGTVELQGGTNAAPSAAGAADKATLIARGVTVLTN